MTSTAVGCTADARCAYCAGRPAGRGACSPPCWCAPTRTARCRRGRQPAGRRPPPLARLPPAAGAARRQVAGALPRPAGAHVRPVRHRADAATAADEQRDAADGAPSPVEPRCRRAALHQHRPGHDQGAGVSGQLRAGRRRRRWPRVAGWRRTVALLGRRPIPVAAQRGRDRTAVRQRAERAAPSGTDTSGRDTRWACLSTTLGAAAHELCHALDLGHAAHGLMGRAYDELWRFCVLETDGGGAGGIRRPPPPGLPAVPGVPAGLRCDASCHAQTVPRPPATSDLTFLDATSAAVLHHHAWCGPRQDGHGAETDAAIQISPAHRVVSSRPLRVVVCRTADEDLVRIETFDGGNC